MKILNENLIRGQQKQKKEGALLCKNVLVH